MSFTGMQTTVNFCILREADLTNELTDIMTDITRSAQETATLADDYSAAKETIQATYSSDSTEYQTAMDEVKDEYQVELAQIAAWESELAVQKEEIETEIQAISTYKESFLAAEKSNIQKDFQYGGSQ